MGVIKHMIFRKVFLNFFVLQILFVLPLFANEDNWQIISMSNFCTFEIPKTMELQEGRYKEINDEFTEKILEIPIDKKHVVAQQRQLNKFHKESFKSYARVMVDTEYGKNGDYENINTQFSATKFELRELDGIYRKEAEKSFHLINSKSQMKMKLLSWMPLKIVQINGVTMIRIRYTRSINNKPEAMVNMYIVQNSDKMHRITISYRMSDSNLWKEDLDKVIYTFKFKDKRK